MAMSGGYVLIVDKTGALQVPAEFYPALEIPEWGGHIWMVRTGPYEVRMTSYRRKGQPEIPRRVGKPVERKVKVGPFQGIGGTESFAHQILCFHMGARIPTAEVQAQYKVWLERVMGTPVWGANAAHLGRAIKKIIPWVRRGRMKEKGKKAVTAYLNIRLRPSMTYDEPPASG